ncbi:hypothetical protein BDZ97DRAFT_1805962 [Flammula alnicola]|nr:hypothetical protein BDZ97DRAFT_1805962 [Flammula alnicola]
MFGQQPWYQNYLSMERGLAEERVLQERALPPDEEDDEDNDLEFAEFGPRQRAYLEATRRQDMLERRQRQEEARMQRALEEQRWQEELERKQREGEEARQKLLQEWKQQLRSKREEARQLAAEHERNARNAPRHASRSPSQVPAQRSPSQTRQGDASIPIPIHVRQSPTAHPSNQTPPSPSKFSHSNAEPLETPAPEQAQPSSPPKATPVRTIEEQDNAATRIQKQYRIHASLRALDHVASQFEILRSNFVYPRLIDFQKPGTENGHVSVPAYRAPSDFNEREETDEAPMDVDGNEGKLAYTSTNFPLHTYVDAMDKLLMKLDEVESWGEKHIREKRRGIVKAIEKEGSRLERYWKQAWQDFVAKQAPEESKPVDEPMDERTDEEWGDLRVAANDDDFEWL